MKKLNHRKKKFKTGTIYATKNCNKNMKIAIFVLQFPPKWLGGTEIATYNIAKYLARTSHEVHVVTALDKGLPKDNIEEKFFVHRILWPKIRFLGGMLFWIKAFWCLIKIKPDVIHFQNIGSGIPAFLFKKLLKKPYVVWARGSDVYLQWTLKEQISKIVLKNADAVIALTEDMKKEIKKIYDKEIFVIPNGIELSKFKGLLKEELRKKLKIKKDEKIILFVGSLRPVKGAKYLIEAMKNIRDRNYRLIVIGEGAERKNLEDLVKKMSLDKRVIFIGKIPNEEVFEYMAASDVFVLPSLSEGFPNVVLEAKASGLPIVATNVRGLPEIVKDRENGFLVYPKKPGQISEKLSLLLGNDELREKISKRNKEKAREYSWENVVDRLWKIYLSVINTKQS